MAYTVVCVFVCRLTSCKQTQILAAQHINWHFFHEYELNTGAFYGNLSFFYSFVLLYKLLFSRGFYFREFREPDPRENFHFNSCLFIVMTTSEKSWN